MFGGKRGKELAAMAVLVIFASVFVSCDMRVCAESNGFTLIPDEKLTSEDVDPYDISGNFFRWYFTYLIDQSGGIIVRREGNDYRISLKAVPLELHEDHVDGCYGYDEAISKVKFSCEDFDFTATGITEYESGYYRMDFSLDHPVTYSADYYHAGFSVTTYENDMEMDYDAAVNAFNHYRQQKDPYEGRILPKGIDVHTIYQEPYTMEIDSFDVSIKIEDINAATLCAEFIGEDGSYVLTHGYKTDSLDSTRIYDDMDRWEEKGAPYSLGYSIKSGWNHETYSTTYTVDGELPMQLIEDDEEEYEEEEKEDIVISTTAEDDVEETGNDVGSDIVEGKEKKKKNKSGMNEEAKAAGAIAAAGALTAAGAAGAASKSGSSKSQSSEKEDQEDEKKKKKYRMKIKKEFGDHICFGEQKEVYARIVEVDPDTGKETDRPDLSQAIDIFCDDRMFDVDKQGALSGNYKWARVSATSNTATDGEICFRFTGAGGSFTNRVTFRITSAMLEFDQPNIAIPHDYDQPMKPYFVVVGLGPEHTVNGKIEPGDAFDVNITKGEDLGVEGAYLYYANIVPKKPMQSMEEREPGASMSYQLDVEAVDKKSGAKAMNSLPIARIRTGLTLTTKNIDCFWYKRVTSEIAEYDGLKRRMVKRDRFAETTAELKLIYFDEEAHRVRVIAPIPKKAPEGFSIKAVNANEQEMVDKLRIQMDPGEEPAFGREGGLQVMLRPTKGYLDAPRRVMTKVHVEATAFGKTFAADKEILLCSQPNRSWMNFEEISHAIKDDAEVRKRLEHLRDVIYRDCYANLFPVHRMIEQQLDGYDPEYGFDEEQIATIINTYNDFCRGYIAGANAQPDEGETIIDYMLWAIDAMGDAADRLEKKAGFLGRLALGVATAGLSEVAFTTMDIVRIPYRMKQAIENGEDTVLGVMWAGSKDIVLGELQGRALGALQSGTWTMAKAFAKDAKNPRLFDIMTKAEKGLTAYNEKIQSVNAKTTIYKDGVFKNPFKAEVDPVAAANAAKQAKISDKELDLELDAKIREARAKNKATDFEGATEHGVEVRERPDGSLEVIGRDLSDPAVAASFRGYEKVVKLHRARNQYYQTKTPEAKLEMESCMLEVREDFIAVNQLKNYNKLYADEVRIEYDNFWTAMDARVDAAAAQGIAARTGKDPAKIYCRSVTTNQGDPIHHTHGVDHDMTQMEKVGEGMPDVEIDEKIQWEENSFAAAEAVTGKRPATLEEAVEIAERYQYTTVAGEGKLAREKYGDVEGMLTPEGHGRALKNVKQNADAMQYKVEQYVDRAEAKLAEAAQYEPGSGEYINAQSSAQRDYFEAGRTGYKQMNRTIIGRNEALMLQGKGNQLSHKEQLCYKLLERYYKGAKQGTLAIDAGDMMNTMKEIGISEPRELARMMSEMTYKVR
jgi:hypothetical protein